MTARPLHQQYIIYKGSSGSGGGENPDPATYCPANGYELPPDPEVFCPANGYGPPPDPAVYCPAEGYIKNPDIFTPDEIIEEAIENPAAKGEIILTVLSGGDRSMNFQVTTSTGQYKVEIFDSNDVLIETTTVNSVTYFRNFVPLGGAYFTYKITAVTGALRSFKAAPQSGFDPAGAKIVACSINAPSLTACDSLFLNMKNLRYCEFLSDCDLVTTFYRAFFYCEALEKVVFPASTAIATNFQEVLMSTLSLKEAVLPTNMPLASQFHQAFYLSNIVGTVTFPASMPELAVLSSCFYGATKIKKVILPTSAPKLISFNSTFRNCYELEEVNIPIDATLVNTITYIFNSCKKLKSPIVFPEMQLCTTIQYAFTDCYELPRLEFTGSMDLCTTIQYFAQNCKKVTHILMPESMKGLITMQQTTNCFLYCMELQYLKLPKYMSDTTWGSPTSAIFGSFTGCYKLAEITEVLDTYDAIMGSLSVNSFLSLLQFNQPKFRVVNPKIEPNGASGTNNIRSALSYIELDWKYVTSLNIKYNNIGGSELLRIIGNLFPAGNVTNPQMISVGSNPCVAELGMKHWAGAPVAGTNRIASFPVGSQGDITGHYIDRGSVSHRVGATFDSATNTVTLIYNHGFTDGKKIAITRTVANIGVQYNTDYYVINAADNYFQLAETPGGSAISFTGSTDGDVAFSIQILYLDDPNAAFTAAYADCNFQTNAYSSWIFIPTINLYELLHKKGWQLYILS